MQRLSYARLAVLSVFLAQATLPLHAILAAPISQKLARGSSSITFGVESPAPVLTMRGDVKTFSGNVTLNPEEEAISDISLSIQLDSARLPPDQMLQGIFLQSVIARLQQRVATFRSTSIDHLQGDDFQAHGTYTWHNKSRRATIPFRLIRSSLATTEIRVLMRGAFTEANTPNDLAASTPGASQATGWAQGRLVFVK
jgi:polyisoprenoid-binding protein YceI